MAFENAKKFLEHIMTHPESKKLFDFTPKELKQAADELKKEGKDTPEIGPDFAP